ncbi:MAG: nicotinate-nucleotide adenylyltransferase [Candidatus Methylopumilus sp.]|jgi:nicotinate-nucleotide adenylyltransferase
MRLIGLMGGTFDPIHFGHLRMAQELADALSADEVRFIPAAHPPLKASVTAANHRAEMVRLAIADNPKFRLDTRELERDGLSYTIDSLISLRKELGEEVALCLFMGSDAFLGLTSWQRWQSLLDYCHIVVAHRPNFSMKAENLQGPLKELWQQHAVSSCSELANKAAGGILMQAITALDISATQIRTAFKQQGSSRYLLPQNVIDYILMQRLYDTPGRKP